MQDFITKDSGLRQEFSTGSKRDSAEGKPRFSLIPSLWLKRLAGLLERGAVKYGENNWQKGQPLKRFYDSAYRHLISASEGDESEDHLAAVAWNVLAMAWVLEEVRAGRLPKELVDLPYTLKAPPKEDHPEKFAGFEEEFGLSGKPATRFPGHGPSCICSQCVPDLSLETLLPEPLKCLTPPNALNR